MKGWERHLVKRLEDILTYMKARPKFSNNVIYKLSSIKGKKISKDDMQLKMTFS